VPDGDDVPGAEEDVELSEVDLLVLFLIPRGLDDTEEVVPMLVELRALMELRGVLDRQARDATEPARGKGGSDRSRASRSR